jgi:hypothetical protein
MSITIREAIANLSEYGLDQPIAIQYWIAADFEDSYTNTDKCLEITQELLNNLNPEVMDNVENNYEGEGK